MAQGSFKSRKPQRHSEESSGDGKNAGRKTGVYGVETKRLIPYSVHLSEEVYLALKEKAKARQASSLVRDAITMILEGNDSFNSGYNKGIRDAMDVIHKDPHASMISIEDQRLSDRLIDQLEGMLENM